MFVRSFVRCSFIRSFVSSFVLSIIRSFVHSIMQLFLIYLYYFGSVRGAYKWHNNNNYDSLELFGTM